jgi:two-component system OmpR family response regulator
MRILVVEDELTLAAQLVEGIKSVGYVVDVAHNGVDGHFMGETAQVCRIIPSPCETDSR